MRPSGRPLARLFKSAVLVAPMLLLCAAPSPSAEPASGAAAATTSVGQAQVSPAPKVDSAALPSLAARREIRLRKLHLVRPDLIPYPIALEVNC